MAGALSAGMAGGWRQRGRGRARARPEFQNARMSVEYGV